MDQYPHIIPVEGQPFLAQFKVNNFFEKVTKTSLSFLAGGPIAGALTGAKESINMVTRNPSPSHLAFELITKSLSVVAIKLLRELDPKKSIVNVKERIKFDIKSQIKELELHIAPNFFDAPEKISLIEAIIPAFQEWFEYMGYARSKATALCLRVPDEFFYAVVDEWSKNEYKDILTALDSPFTKAWERKYRKKLYYSKLREEVHTPAMGDELLPLSKIYIKPNFSIHGKCCGEKKWKKDKDDFIAEIPFKKSIHEYMEQRLIYNQQPLGLPVEKSNLIFLLGQPGQGKSSFCLYTINQLINHKDFKKELYFIRLKYLDAKRLIEQPFSVIAEYLQQKHRLEFNGANALIVLDGLDELYMSQGISDKGLENLYHKLETELGQYEGLSIILTSRYNYLHLSAIDRDKTTILKLEGLSIDQQKRWLSSYQTVHSNCNLNNEVIDEINENGELQHIKELIDQPILLHIIASTNIKIDASLDRAMVYQELFDLLLNRNWDKSGQLPTYKKLQEKYKNKEGYERNFRYWLQEIAFGIYQSDFEYIHKDALKKLDMTKKNLDKMEMEDALKNLLVAFYFQNASKDSKDFSKNTNDNYAIEFLHKSLQEYLVAEHVWNVIKEDLLESSQKRGNSNYIINTAEKTLELFGNLFGTKVLNVAVLKHLEEIIFNDKFVNKEELGTRLGLFLTECLKYQFIYKYQGNKIDLYPIESATNTFLGYWLIYSNLGLKENIIPIYEKESNFYKFLRIQKGEWKLNLENGDFREANLKGVILKVLRQI